MAQIQLITKKGLDEISLLSLSPGTLFSSLWPDLCVCLLEPGSVLTRACTYSPTCTFQFSQMATCYKHCPESRFFPLSCMLELVQYQQVKFLFFFFFLKNGYQLRSLFENTDSLVSLEYISKIVICLFILTALSLCCCVGFSLVEWGAWASRCSAFSCGVQA